MVPIRKLAGACVMAVAAVAFVYATTGPSGAPGPPPGTSLGPLVVTDLDGNALDLRPPREKLLFLNFWATWCGPCRRETPDLVRLQSEFDASVDVVGVSVQESEEREAVRAFAGQYGVSYPITFMNDALEAAFGSIEVVPTSFLIDRNGYIVERFTGAVEFDTIVKAVVKHQPAPARR